ncbi:winged helix-turn-helix domain-containing protein [Synechococcus sp. CBW1004]|uniref:winged helix-turn-helix domain-containing protein n=1 Tax=Synechococcus sp. CBW1004 TaxID=1353136 RepID=UPI00351BE588
MTAPLLLVGAEAEALAPRLAVSGYRPLRLEPGRADPVPLPIEPPLAADPGRDLRSSVAAMPGRGADPAPPEAPAPTPLAVVLSPGEQGRIPELRRRWGALPILLGLADDSVAGRSHTLLSGADDFWLTEVGPSDLLTRLRLHRQLPAAMQGPECLQVADLQLWPASGQVSRGGRGLALTAREYQLLLLMLERRGQVLSREEILQRVWPEQQPGSASNVIEVYVRYLRQKLEQGGERRLIHTVRGRGYCLCEGLPPRPDAP